MSQTYMAQMQAEAQGQPAALWTAPEKLRGQRQSPRGDKKRSNKTNGQALKIKNVVKWRFQQITSENTKQRSFSFHGQSTNSP